MERLAKALDDRGVKVWWDPKIQTGSSYRPEISHALAEASAVVVVWSRYSVSSRFVCDEADEGAARGILFPALIDAVDIPLGFRQLQTADLTRWNGRMNDRAFQAFVDTVADYAGSGRRAQPPQPEPDRGPPEKKPAPVKQKPKKYHDYSRYSTTGARQRVGLFIQSALLTLIAAGAFAAIAYLGEFVFEEYRNAFIGVVAVLAFLSRYGTFQADRASGAASTHLLSRSFLSLIFFSLILLAPIVLEGRIYAAALQGVQVKGIDGADINGVSLSRDGTKLLTSSDDGTARVWDVASGVERGAFRDHEHWVWNSAFSPDGSLAVSASRDLTARVWRTGIGGVEATLEGHARSVYDSAWSPDGEAIATASNDGSVKLWDPETYKEARTLSAGGSSVNAIDFSPDGTWLASASDDGHARVWNWRTGGLRNVAAAGGAVHDVRFSHDGTMVAAATESGRVRVWRAEGMSRLIDIDHGARAFSAAFLDGDALLATSGIDPVIRVWSLSDGSLVRELEGHRDAIRTLDSTPNGAELVSGSRDNTARVWDAATGEEMQIMGHVKPALRLAAAIDAPPVLSASRAPVPMDFRGDPMKAGKLLAKGAGLAIAMTLAALIVKALLWMFRLRPIARWAVTATLFAGAAYAGLLMASALPIEALWLWLTLAFVPAAILSLLRWVIAASFSSRKPARSQTVKAAS